MPNNIQSIADEIDRLDPPELRQADLPDDRLITQYEIATGFSFPDDYKVLLKRSSNAFVGTLDLLRLDPERRRGPGELVTEVSLARGAGVPPDWLPICQDNGDYYCLHKDGSVRFWDHNGSTNEIWPSLAVWAAEVWVGGH